MVKLTLEDVVESLSKKYKLDSHFSGFVMASLGEFLDEEVSKDFNIDYLADSYIKQINNGKIPVVALYWEEAYNNRFNPLSFFRYLESNSLILKVSYEINCKDLDIFSSIIKNLSKDYNEEELISEKRLNDILLDYGIDEKFDTKDTKIMKKNVRYLVADFLKKSNQYDNSKGKITLYNLIKEKCKGDNKCTNFILNDLFDSKDFIISENSVEMFKKAIGRFVAEYKSELNEKLLYII